MTGLACPVCRGTGAVTAEEPSATDGRPAPFHCPACNGTGYARYVLCSPHEPPNRPSVQRRKFPRGPRGKVNARAKRQKRKAQKRARRANR